MPVLQLLCSGNATSYDLNIPAEITAKHFHLKSVDVKFKYLHLNDGTTPSSMQIRIPFLRHFYQINSSTGRASITVLLDMNNSLTRWNPNIVLVNENISKNVKIELLKSSDGSPFVCGKAISPIVNAAPAVPDVIKYEELASNEIEYVMVTFEYVD